MNNDGVIRSRCFNELGQASVIIEYLLDDADDTIIRKMAKDWLKTWNKRIYKTGENDGTSTTS